MAVLKNKTLNDFFIYWDGVIASWLEEKFAFEQQLSQDASKQELEIQKQEQILGQEWLNLSRNHMPEPYWGNPEKCSIVIANYNPGGGADRNRHVHFKCADWEHTFINEVKKSKYSDVASGFPIIDESNPNDLESAPEWWEDYGGSNWWLNKKKWLEEYIIPAFENAENIKKKKPFAIEFCGWHSVSWPSGACAKIYKNEVLKPVIDKCFIDVLIDAIKQSESKLGVCVGAQFYHMFISKGMTPISYKNTDSPKYDLHLFEINNAKILSIWGAGYNRFPNIDSKKLKELLEKQDPNKGMEKL